MSPRRSLRPLGGLVLRTQPDSRLVSLFREGHQCAFEEIVRRYRAALVGFAGGIVPRHQAEDVVQESLVRAHGALQGENEIDVRPWLYTIVRNRALNAIRDEHAHEHLSEDYDGVPQPPDVLGRKEEMAGLVAKLKALPETQRQAIVQRELEGRSHEEIAIALGATPGAVRGLIFRAREGLRAVGGFVVPSTLLDALLGSPGTTGAIGGIAAGGGAGLLMKAGVAATVGVVALGSGIAMHNRSKADTGRRVAEQAHVGRFAREASGATASKAAAGSETGSASSRGEGSGSSNGDGSSGPGSTNSGPGSGDGSSGNSASSTSGSGSGGSGGDGSSGDDGGSSGGHSGPGGGGSDDGSGGSSGPGGGGSGSDDGSSTTSGGGGSGSGSDDGSGTSGSGTSGGSGSGSDDGGTSGGGGTGSGGGHGSDDPTTTTPTTTTPSGGGDVVAPLPGVD